MEKTNALCCENPSVRPSFDDVLEKVKEQIAIDCVPLATLLQAEELAAIIAEVLRLRPEDKLRVDGVIRQGEGLEPSARGMLTLVRAIREKGTSAVITEPQYPDRAGKTLAAETGITCITLDPMASGPEDAPLDYYENVMRENLRILEQALGS